MLLPPTETRPPRSSPLGQLFSGDPSPAWPRYRILSGKVASKLAARQSQLPAGKLALLIEEFDTGGSSPATGRAMTNLFRLALAGSERISLVKPEKVRAALESIGLGGQTVRGTISRAVAAKTSARLIPGGSVRRDGGEYVLSVTAF